MVSLQVSLRQPPAWSTMRSTFPRPTVGRRDAKNAKNAKQKILESLQTTFASFLHPLPVRLAIFTHAPNRKNSHQRHTRRIVDSNCWLVESVVVNGCRRGTLQNHWVQHGSAVPGAGAWCHTETLRDHQPGGQPCRCSAKNDGRLRRLGRFQKSHEIPKPSDWCHDLPRGSLLSLGFRAAQRSMSYKTDSATNSARNPKTHEFDDTPNSEFQAFPHLGHFPWNVRIFDGIEMRWLQICWNICKRTAKRSNLSTTHICSVSTVLHWSARIYNPL